MSKLSPYALSLLRIVAGLTFMEHGTAKHLHFPVLERLPAVHSLSWWGGFLELVGGGLLVLGLFTRPVAFILSGMMAVAYFTAHFPRNFFPILNGGDAAILYCFVFLYLAAAGGGPVSLSRRG